MSWECAAKLSEVESKAVVFKKAPKQIVIYKVDESIFALDNRCPHEGYPLAEGSVDDNCMLTCNWHNWKFRLEDGECVLGGDNVRTYPTKVEDGDVWVNVADPSPEVIEEGIIRGLKIAFDEQDFGRICREISRLYYNKLDPLVGVRKAIEWSYDRFEYGTTHAFAACADWLEKYAEFEGDWERQLICLAETVDHMAFDALRHPKYAFANDQVSFDEAALVDAVEREDVKIVESMVFTGLQQGLHWSDMESAFSSAALLHFNDFGHSAIYVYKTAQVIERLGPDVEAFLIMPLARHLCYTMREDLLPDFKSYGELIESIKWYGDDKAPKPDPRELFPMSVRQTHLWLQDMAFTYTPGTLYWPMLECLSQNLLHYDPTFDTAFDRPVNNNISWLHFSHGITFANAVRYICLKYPELWTQGLMQMGCMIGRNRHFLDLELDEYEWVVDDADAYVASLDEKILDHGMRDPIFSAHVIKTAVAVREEMQEAPNSCRRFLAASLHRLMNATFKQKHTRRLARQAIDLVSRDF